jgi:hypothetical protein
VLNPEILAAGAALTLALATPAHPGPPAARDGGGAADIAQAQRALQKVTVDALDNDPVWRSAPRIDGFRQYEPEQDADPSQRTVFQVSYDSDNLYVLVRAYDTHPDSIMHALSRRDVQEASDQIGIYIDSYNDRRTGFVFWVNPDGVKRDFAVYDDSDQDDSWNGVWDVATRTDSLGWTAEFRIPFSQLRYAVTDHITFGFGVRRVIERHNEVDSWPLYSRTVTGIMSQLGHLDGLEGLASARRLELTPYLVTKNVTRARSQGGFEHPQEVSVGGDLKLGLTPGVTLNATINPDFGQVEADPAVLNLTAFETFYSERRPFFVEGTGLYKFALNCYIVVDCSTNEGLFYSRRIGRSPSLSSLYGDARTPEATPIAAAAKLTGRRSGGLSYGVIEAYTRAVEGTQGRTAEPGTNYAVLRARQDLHGGDAGVSWIGTAVNRSLDPWSAPYLHKSAYVTGASFRSRFDEKKYEVAGSFAASRVAGSPQAILLTQESSAHYYQQPGDRLEVDSTRTSLSGYAAQIKVGKYGGGITRFETSLERQSGGFEVNDLGYLRRVDLQDWSTWAALTFQSPTKLYRWAQVNGNTWHQWNTSGTRLESAVNFNFHMGFHNNWDAHLGGTLSHLGRVFCDRCTRGGPTLRRSRAFYPWFGVNTDARRTLSAGIWTNLSRTDEGRTRSASLSPYLQMRLGTGIQATLGADIYDAADNTQWFGNFIDADGTTHYTFAHLDQRTVSMSLRVSYAATPDLTFELYGEPFASGGTYSDLREVSGTPDAAGYADRFTPYAFPTGSARTFTYRQLRTNAVLRWEYLPGSTLFVVWAHGRQDSAQTRQPWQDDFAGLFDLHPDNTFLVKVAYWFNR